jgi:molybdopterin synthase catalytic subunit
VEKIILTRDPLDADLFKESLKRYDAGALVVFAGSVRAEDACSRQLLALDYAAYQEMAIEQMTALRQKAIDRFGVLDVCIAHRLGRLKLSEVSIVVAVAAAHRLAAFDACRWIVDQVKTDVPIWKKDIWSDGREEWVDPTCASE